MSYHSKMNMYFFPLLAFIMLSGCAASGPKFSNNQKASEPGSVKLIIYYPRPREFLVLRPEILLNKNSLGLLKRAGFLIHTTIPGDYLLEAMILPSSLSSTNILLVDNTTTYIRFNPRGKEIKYIASCFEDEDQVTVCRRTSYQPTFEIAQEETALNELANLKLSQQ